MKEPWLSHSSDDLKSSQFHVMKKDKVSNPLQFVYIEDYFDEYLNFKSDLDLIEEQKDEMMKDSHNIKAIT